VNAVSTSSERRVNELAAYVPVMRSRVLGRKFYVAL